MHKLTLRHKKARYVSSYTHTDRLELTATPLEAFWVTRVNRGKSPLNFYFNFYFISFFWFEGDFFQVPSPQNSTRTYQKLHCKGEPYRSSGQQRQTDIQTSYSFCYRYPTFDLVDPNGRCKANGINKTKRKTYELSQVIF